MSIKKDVGKYIARKEQVDALNYIKRIFKEKPDNKFFLLNMPVGIGKSHIAVMISDFYTSQINKGSQVDIITAGKLLQDQYESTYEYINSLKGKDNYKCVQYACSCASGKEFNKLNKSKCDFCPYDSARNAYISGEVSLTNFHLYLINAIYGKGGMMKDREVNARILIVDECLHPDTQIVLSNGCKKKITDIIIGDIVKTINEETGEIEFKEVEFIYHNLSKTQQMYEMEMEDGSILKITGNHKVKLITGEWKKVEDLTTEDEIINIYENKKY